MMTRLPLIHVATKEIKPKEVYQLNFNLVVIAGIPNQYTTVEATTVMEWVMKEISDLVLLCEYILLVFSQQSSMTKPSINFHGVKEGNSYGYDFGDVVFEFAGQPVRLYTDPEGDAVCFEHFTKFPDGRCTPSGYGLLDFKLFQNLQNQNFIAMRPIQLAAFMAVLFQAPDHTASPKDFLGISETGSGKTMAFLVPIIQKCLQKAATTGRNLKPTALIFVYSNLLAVNIFQRAQDLTSGTNVKVELICGGKSFIKNTHFDVGICTSL